MDLQAAIEHCAHRLAPQTVFAILKHESGAKPFQIGVNHPNFRLKKQPQSPGEAVAIAQSLMDKGYDIDMGLMQINSRNYKKMGMPLSALFNPCQNIKTGSQILIRNYQRASLKYGEGEKAFLSALSAYNTGSFERGIKNGYVDKVLAQMKKAGRFFSKKEARKESLVRADKVHLPGREASQPQEPLNPYTASTRVDGFYERVKELARQRPIKPANIEGGDHE